MKERCRLGYLVKGFPRISETFILNEILEIERQGVPLKIYSMIKPKESKRHSHADDVKSEICYLPYPLLRSFFRYAYAHFKLFFRHPLRYPRTFLKVAGSFDRDLLERFVQAGYLAGLLKKDRIGHLHAGFVHAPGSVAWIVHMITGISFSVAAHAKDLYHSPRSLLSKKFSTACLVLTCTKYNEAYLHQAFPEFSIPKLHHVYHGVDLQRFPFGPYGLAAVPLILSVARLVEKKGLNDLIAACKILREKGRVFKCRIIGGGELKTALMQQIKEEGVEGLVSLEGPMAQEEVRFWYRQALIFALPSLITANGDRDGIPNVLVEAASMGIPIVTTGVSGISELVKNEETGLAVPSKSPKDLAEALERLLDSAELREKLRCNARAFVEEKFSLHRNASFIADKMKNLIGVK